MDPIEESLVIRRNLEWDNFFARCNTYTGILDVSLTEMEQVYGKQTVEDPNGHFTSLKLGFRKGFPRRKKLNRSFKLALQVTELDKDISDVKVLSDDSSMYTSSVELELDCSNSESVDSVQYVLQCNEQRKLPDFNTKVENCQTYLLKNAIFNKKLEESDTEMFINNRIEFEKALQSKNKSDISIFSQNISRTKHSTPLKKIRQIEFNSNSESSDSENINKSQVQENDKFEMTTQIEIKKSDNVSSRETKINNGHSNEENVFPKHKQKLHKTPSQQTRPTKNISFFHFSTEAVPSDDECFTVKSDLSDENDLLSLSTHKHIVSKINHLSVPLDVDSNANSMILKTNLSAKTGPKLRNVQKNENKENEILKKCGKNSTEKESKVQKYSSELNSETSQLIVNDRTGPVNKINSVKKHSKLSSVKAKNKCKILLSNTEIPNLDKNSSSLVNEKSNAENSDNSENKENGYATENCSESVTKRTQENKVCIKTSLSEVDSSDSDFKISLEPKSNILRTESVKKNLKNKFAKNNFIKENKTVNDKMYKQCLEDRAIVRESNIDAEIREIFSSHESRSVIDEVVNICEKKKSDEFKLQNKNNKDNEITSIFLKHKCDIENDKSALDNVYSRKTKHQVCKSAKARQCSKINLSGETSATAENYDEKEVTMPRTIVNNETTHTGRMKNNNNISLKGTDLKNKTLSFNESTIILEEVQSNTPRRNSRKNKSKLRVNINTSPPLSVIPNSDNQHTANETVKCRQRLFTSFSKNDDIKVENSNTNFKSTALIKGNLKTSVDNECEEEFMNMFKENSEDLIKGNNETHLLRKTIGIISDSNKNLNGRNTKKRKIGDSNCGSVKQTEKKHRTTRNSTNKNDTKQISLNEMLKSSVKRSINKFNEQLLNHEPITKTKSDENTNNICQNITQYALSNTVNGNIPNNNSTNIANNMKQNSTINTNPIQIDMAERTIDENSVNPSTRDENETSEKHTLSEKEKDRKQRRKRRKPTRFIEFSTDDYNVSTTINSGKNRTHLSLEYFLNDDIF